MSCLQKILQSFTDSPATNVMAPQSNLVYFTIKSCSFFFFFFTNPSSFSNYDNFTLTCFPVEATQDLKNEFLIAVNYLKIISTKEWKLWGEKWQIWKLEPLLAQFLYRILIKLQHALSCSDVFSDWDNIPYLAPWRRSSCFHLSWVWSYGVGEAQLQLSHTVATGYRQEFSQPHLSGAEFGFLSSVPRLSCSASIAANIFICWLSVKKCALGVLRWSVWTHVARNGENNVWKFSR